jgi:hypothetical protein
MQLKAVKMGYIKQKKEAENKRCMNIHNHEEKNFQ